MNIHSVPSATVTDKRAAILDAATAIFARRGFFGAQVADVARAAGIAAGTVYLYFRSKDEILTSIFDRTMQEAIAEGRASLADVSDPVERLRHIARLHLARMGRDRNLAIVFQVELRQTTKFMEQFSATGLRDEMATNWILSHRRYALADQADEIVDLFAHGLVAPAPGAAR
jgi:TetR/AcrR family fatty acid metabolism transcriptional regulator